MPLQSSDIASRRDGDDTESVDNRDPGMLLADDDDDDDDNDDDEMAVDLEVSASIRNVPSSLYIRPQYFRQTRNRGKIFKTVEERYIRDDLGFGCYFASPSSSAAAASSSSQIAPGRPRVIENAQRLLALLQPCRPFSLVVCDTNVLLHNLDVLEHAVVTGSMPNIVIPQTALFECRSNRMVSYDRTVDLLRANSSNTKKSSRKVDESKAIPTKAGQCCIFFPDVHHVATAHVTIIRNKPDQTGDTPNDVNDARIRSVAHYFGENLRSSQVRVVLLTDDSRCRRLAQEESPGIYQAYSVQRWVQELEQQNPDVSLMDMVAQFSSKTAFPSLAGLDYAMPDGFEPYPGHVSSAELSQGVQSGVYHRGVFRPTMSMTRSVTDMDGTVTIRHGDDRVAVTLRNAMECNRALNGDIVAIVLNPVDQWIPRVSDHADSTNKSVSSDPPAGSETGIAAETAEPTESEINNVPDETVVMVENVAQSLRPTGRVVGILRRNFDSHCGSIYAPALRKSIVKKKTKDEDSSHISDREQVAAQFEREHSDGTMTCVFFPVDKSLPPVLIRTIQRERLIGLRIIVAMDSWPAESPYPLGHYVRTVGPVGAKEVETDVLLQQHDIPHEPFSAAVLACLPPTEYRIDLNTSPDRVDLRHIPVLSIDPPGCKDIDDALHCIVLPNGNHQIGVHIADVAHYVKAGTAIDLEAARRSTSTYLVDKRLDMLPGLLTTDLCSLKGNVDRFAFSVLWEVTPEGEILKVDFHKTIIHSIAALTYQQAQVFIDQQPDESDVAACSVKRLASMARIFRKRRLDAGALTLASPEVKFVMDRESLNPTDIQSYALQESNAVVEEFMLLANVTVAKRILRQYPTLSVLRRHPAPNRTMFDSLISKAKCIGLDIKIGDSKLLADSLDAAEVPSDPYVNKLLRILSTRCMSPAQYFCSGEYRPAEWHHYGLAAPVYTHFTSPIRRYADVCVHRLLAAAIGVAPLPPHLSSKSYVHDLCANMNRRHRAAQLAGRASVQLHTLIFFATAGTENKDQYFIEDAYVLDVETAQASSPSFTVMIPRYGIEGRVRLDIAPDDPQLHRFPSDHRITYNANSGNGREEVSIKVFDKVKVNIWVRENQDQRELVLELHDPVFASNHLKSVSSSGLSDKKRQVDSSSHANPQSKKSKKSR